MHHQIEVSQRHRASYILERGVWTATCRICGYTVRDPSRARAATWFLAHIRAGRLEVAAAGDLLAEGAWREEGADAAKATVAPSKTAANGPVKGGTVAPGARAARQLTIEPPARHAHEAP